MSYGLVRINLSVIFLYLPFIVFSQNQYATVQGTVEVVVDTTGRFYSPPNTVEGNPYALASATVLLLDKNNRVVQGVSSNKYGEFRIDSIPPGKYLLSVKHVGFEENVTSISLHEGEVLQKKVILGKIYATEELPFSEKDAEQDIEKGIVEFKWFNLIRSIHFVDPDLFRKAETKARKKFGFSVKDISANYENHNWHKVYQAVKRYNSEVEAHLSHIHGRDWRERFDIEVQKIYRQLDGAY